MTERLLSVEEIAERIGCSIRTVRRWVASGSLASVKVGGLRRVSPSALDRFLGIERTDWGNLARCEATIFHADLAQNDREDASDD